jgi:hypothetical protein
MANNEGSWVTVQPSIEPLLAPIQPVLTILESVLEVLITTLNVASAILEVVKTFIAGLLNPIRALVEELVALVKGFLSDLRSIGLYLYVGDAKQAKPNFSVLLGGYAAFENRLVRALVDGNDATRPQATSATSVIGVVFYLSVDITLVFQILRLRRALQRLFGFKVDDAPPFPAPVQLSVNYGNPSLGLASFTGITKRLSVSGQLQAASLRWRMPAPQQNTPNPSPPPGGFVVEVCTVSGGLGVYADAPVINSGTIVGRKKIGVIDPLSSESVVAYGGTDNIATESFTNSPDAPQIYFVANQNDPVIPVNALQALETTTEKRYFGRSFFVRNSAIRALPPGQGFGMMIRKEDLPYTGTVVLAEGGKGHLYGDLEVRNAYQPSKLYVVVRAVDEDRAKQILAAPGREGTGSAGNPATYTYPLYQTITPADIKASATAEGEYEAIIDSDNTRGGFGRASTFAGINFPSDALVVDTIQTALLIAILSRSDLPVPISEGGATPVATPGTAAQPTGLEAISKTELKSLSLDNQFFARFKDNPQAFCKTLLNRVETIANRLLQSALLSLEPTLVSEVGREILAFKWSDADPRLPSVTILQSVRDTASGMEPLIGSTRYSNPVFLSLTLRSPPAERAPYFWDTTSLGGTALENRRTNTDNSPIVIGEESSGFSVGVFCRNALADVYDNAQAVLSLITDTNPNRVGPYQVSPNWVAIRFIPNGIPQLDRLLANIEAFADAFLDGLSNVGQAIIAYIEFLQARIRDIQAFLDQIQAIIDFIRSLTLPSVSALVVTGTGTGGLLRSIVSADNKPADSPNAYGFGFGVVGVGLPVFIMDLLGAILAPPSSEGGA